MTRDCCFLSGESGLTMKVAFRRERWEHSCAATKLEPRGEYVGRRLLVNEQLRGLIFHADMDDKEASRRNFELMIASKTVCWPPPARLLAMNDRHVVMRRCIKKGFAPEARVFINDAVPASWALSQIKARPAVFKVGNSHRGEGKYLVNSIEDTFGIPCDGDLMTVEPFYTGASVRALFIGVYGFGLRLDNDQSWLKNTAGANISRCELSNEIIDHACAVANEFGLEIAGVDYIVEDDGSFHFLEVNQFPGVANIDDRITECAEAFFDEKMRDVEREIDERAGL